MSGPFDPRMLPPLRSALAGEWDVVHTHGSRANLPVRVAPAHPRAGSAEFDGQACPRYTSPLFTLIFFWFTAAVFAPPSTASSTVPRTGGCGRDRVRF